MKVRRKVEIGAQWTGKNLYEMRILFGTDDGSTLVNAHNGKLMIRGRMGSIDAVTGDWLVYNNEDQAAYKYPPEVFDIHYDVVEG